MRGFPKVLNSRQDYENIISDFGYTAKVKRAYEGLLNTAEKYEFDKELAAESDRTGPAPEYKVMTQEEEGTEKIVQYKLVNNPDGKIFKLGFTIGEVEEVIAQC
ncbi:hypothetical protein [Halanaerobium salsuginis]|uniref:Uncharacterized protein n=1 Tax=Halanaerobium salsuginis TaxID=29563 RepID=A0A1I4LR14_9FIRM|nr:hypothetical protein [Halanaerobium salsuginis]SFL93462.1 hypothetical protein SAMN02983006_02384 [Halanaerobium salsuginis]